MPEFEKVNVAQPPGVVMEFAKTMFTFSIGRRKKRPHVARSGSPAILQLPRDAALYYRQLFTTEGRSGFGELRRFDGI